MLPLISHRGHSVPSSGRAKAQLFSPPPAQPTSSRSPALAPFLLWSSRPSGPLAFPSMRPNGPRVPSPPSPSFLLPPLLRPPPPASAAVGSAPSRLLPTAGSASESAHTWGTAPRDPPLLSPPPWRHAPAPPPLSLPRPMQPPCLDSTPDRPPSCDPRPTAEMRLPAACRRHRAPPRRGCGADHPLDARNRARRRRRNNLPWSPRHPLRHPSSSPPRNVASSASFPAAYK